MLTQTEQDRIWNHYQNRDRATFDLSYPRLRYLADRCAPGSRVLTIGVGSGYLEELLLHQNVELYSLDPSQSSIDRLRNEFGMGDRARHGYGQNIPFAENFFNKVIMTEVLEHLPTDVLDATLDEVWRVLQPNGELTGTVPYSEQLSAGLVICPHCDRAFHRWGHEQTFDRESLTALFVRHRFKIQILHARAFPDFRRTSPRLLLKAVGRYVLGRLGEQVVGPNLYFRVRRPNVRL